VTSTALSPLFVAKSVSNSETLSGPTETGPFPGGAPVYRSAGEGIAAVLEGDRDGILDRSKKGNEEHLRKAVEGYMLKVNCGLHCDYSNR
jgi:hypothetical protein